MVNKTICLLHPDRLRVLVSAMSWFSLKKSFEKRMKNTRHPSLRFFGINILFQMACCLQLLGVRPFEASYGRGHHKRRNDMQILLYAFTADGPS